jgi:hypothetical protein
MIDAASMTNADPKYPESIAYHEAGHVAIAAAKGIRLSRHGIRVDEDGRGIAYYDFRKPKRTSTAPSEVTREQTIVATLAGRLSQQKFYPQCSILGADCDNVLVDELLAEIGNEDPIFGLRQLTTQVELHEEAVGLVEAHWPKIKAIGQELWAQPYTTKQLDQPNQVWSPRPTEKALAGYRVAEILKSFGMDATIWDPGDVIQD